MIGLRRAARIFVVSVRRLIAFVSPQVLEESDTSSEISCRKDALNLENGDFKTSIEKAITKLPRIQHLVSARFILCTVELVGSLCRFVYSVIIY